MITFKKPLFSAASTTVALLGLAFGSVPALAQSAAPSVVAGRSLGKVNLGQTPAQVHKTLGKPGKNAATKERPSRRYLPRQKDADARWTDHA